MADGARDRTRADDGTTPIDEDESEGLLPTHLISHAELNQWEARNITRALRWVALRTPRVLDVRFLQNLHRRMFDETWAWAGTFRRSDKSISPFHWTEVPRLLHDLVADTRERHAQCDGSAIVLDTLAARFHHELVRIHPWPNGNGRHARLATDLLLRNWRRPPFTWGALDSAVDRVETRARYLTALRAADAGSLDSLLQFVRT